MGRRSGAFIGPTAEAGYAGGIAPRPAWPFVASQANGVSHKAVPPKASTQQPEEYEAVVPGEQVEGRWDFMYLFEVMDRCGNGKIYPDLEVETPYVIVPLDR